MPPELDQQIEANTVNEIAGELGKFLADVRKAASNRRYEVRGILFEFADRFVANINKAILQSTTAPNTPYRLAAVSVPIEIRNDRELIFSSVASIIKEAISRNVITVFSKQYPLGDFISMTIDSESGFEDSSLSLDFSLPRRLIADSKKTVVQPTAATSLPALNTITTEAPATQPSQNERFAQHVGEWLSGQVEQTVVQRIEDAAHKKPTGNILVPFILGDDRRALKNTLQILLSSRGIYVQIHSSAPDSLMITLPSTF